MEGSTPQHYTVADFVKWFEDKELVLNPTFQRGSVWPNHARTYLIDSILRGYPIPKLLLRTTVDRQSRRTVRDVVDGQQRLRTIFDFVNNKLILGSKANGFEGKRYEDLSGDDQDAFLAYKLTCEQLINASDDDVLEVFARINSYAVPVNEPELRNAQFDTVFSDYVKRLAKTLAPIWAMGVLGERDRVRMIDQSATAELVAILTRGVVDGSEKDITRFYEQNRHASLAELPSESAVEEAVWRLAPMISEFAGEPVIKRPHFLMLFAASQYVSGSLPPGKLQLGEYETYRVRGLAPRQLIQDGLVALNAALASQEAATSSDLAEFRDARATTQRMKSRTTRFGAFVKALTGTLSV